MSPVQKCDYDRPTSAALVGITMEANDRFVGEAADGGTVGPPKWVAEAIQCLEERFGLTLCVDDGGVEESVRI